MPKSQELELEITSEAIREQLELIIQDRTFRTSKRSVQFLRYVVEQTLRGSSDQIKERTIGVEVFGREPSYDTAADHVVRTAAIELRRRLVAYYADERHQGELRVNFIPGSYVPHFTAPSPLLPDISGGSAEAINDAPRVESQGEPHKIPIYKPVKNDVPPQKWRWMPWLLVGSFLLSIGAIFFGRDLAQDPAREFWRPLVSSPGPVLLAVGDIPNGPPTITGVDQEEAVPIIPKGVGSNVPYADTVTIARVLSALQSQGKTVIMRPEASASFSDFRDNPAVLIGAFNNEWSLRLTHALRFSLELDQERHLIYIRDAKNPSSRRWSQLTANTIQQQFDHGHPPHQDYALITRRWNSETGQVVVILGGLYAYGTQAAGEFLTDRGLMKSIEKILPLGDPKATLQVVLETTVTDDTPGVAKVLAVSSEKN